MEIKDKKTFEDVIKTPYIVIMEDDIRNIPNDNELGAYVRAKLDKKKSNNVDYLK